MRLISIKVLNVEDTKLKFMPEKKYFEDEYSLTEAWTLIMINSFTYLFVIDFYLDTSKNNDSFKEKVIKTKFTRE